MRLTLNDLELIRAKESSLETVPTEAVPNRSTPARARSSSAELKHFPLASSFSLDALDQKRNSSTCKQTARARSRKKATNWEGKLRRTGGAEGWARSGGGHAVRETKSHRVVQWYSQTEVENCERGWKRQAGSRVPARPRRVAGALTWSTRTCCRAGEKSASR